ncbi:MAG: diguanylate cyclase [Candidatus Tectimicrobiota bacterium]
MVEHLDTQVRILREIAQSEGGVLKPGTSLESACGYCYPAVHTLLETRPGEEIDSLEALVEMGYLDHQPCDKVHLCPFCSHFALNFREVCPQCGSTAISIVQMLHHFRCGYVAPEHEFRDGVLLVCPKCSRELRHIGVDYERPTSTYACAVCQHVFHEPKISCLSLPCGQVFGVERALTRTIYTYRLTPRGALAVTRGRLEDASPAGALIVGDLAVYTWRFLEERLAQELRHIQRYRRPGSLLLLCPDHLQAYATHTGVAAAAALFHSMTQVIKETLRDCDIPALYGEHTLAILLPDTSVEGAYTAAERLRQRVLALTVEAPGPRVTLAVGLVDCTRAGLAPRQVMAMAHASLTAAQQAGGNCVYPAPAAR